MAKIELTLDERIVLRDVLQGLWGQTESACKRGDRLAGVYKNQHKVLGELLNRADVVEPDAQPETVLIVVKGGLVQGASATLRDLNIIVQDLDNLPDAQERGEGDCSYIESHTVMSAAEIEQQIQDNLEMGI